MGWPENREVGDSESTRARPFGCSPGPASPIFLLMSESQSSLPRLFAEMKRRKVFRVMAVYGATAFVLLQAADLLAEGMGLSDQVLRITTFVVLIGFPIAIVLAWAFETTPDGVKPTEGAAPGEISEILAQPASRRWPAGPLARWPAGAGRCSAAVRRRLVDGTAR